LEVANVLATALLLFALPTALFQQQGAPSGRQIILTTGDVIFVGSGTDARLVLRREADLRIAITPDGREAIVLVDQQTKTSAPDGLVDRAYRFELQEEFPAQYLYRGTAVIEELHEISDGSMRRPSRLTFVTPLARLRFGHAREDAPSEDVVIRTGSIQSRELAFGDSGDRRFDAVEYAWINHLEDSHSGMRASVSLTAEGGAARSRGVSRILTTQTLPQAVTPPQALDQVPPFYAPDAMRRGVQGSVLLELTVLPDGRVGEIKVIRSLDPDLDRAAVAAATKWRFRPALRNGQPVAAPVTVEMAFTLGPNR